jgi:hypothetical protein
MVKLALPKSYLYKNQSMMNSQPTRERGREERGETDLRSGSG